MEEVDELWFSATQHNFPEETASVILHMLVSMKLIHVAILSNKKSHYQKLKGMIRELTKGENKTKTV